MFTAFTQSKLFASLEAPDGGNIVCQSSARHVASLVTRTLMCCRVSRRKSLSEHQVTDLPSCLGERMEETEISHLASRGVLCGEEIPLQAFHTIHRGFEDVVRSNPERADSTGIIFEGKFLSYAELDKISTAVAWALMEIIRENRPRIGRDQRQTPIVAIDIQPCEALIVAILGILKIGAAYLPVDSHTAINRVRYIVNEVKPICILVDSTSEFKTDMDTVWSRFHVLDMDEILMNARNISCPGRSPSLRSNVFDRSTTMSIIYTSGSTGKPKGVVLSHRTALNRLVWQWNTLPFTRGEVGVFKTSLLFVDSIVEIFSCLLTLTPLVIVPKGITSNPERFLELLEHHRVTRIVAVPSLLRTILMYLTVSGGSTRLPALNLWISNSETLTVSLANKFFDIFEERKLLCNFYGCTEIMADVTFEIFGGKADISGKAVENNLSIGKPMCNSMIYIVNEELELLEPGEVGEICVSGLNVATGYVDELTTGASASFVKNPIIDHPYHPVLYRTGDFGRLYEGRVIYEGRRDMQIKIRGQRVSIAEIEQVVQECPGVEKVVVRCHNFSEISNVIVAYFTISGQQRQKHVENEIVRSCRRSLPEYMRPKLLCLQEIPLQPHSGKVDAEALRRLYEKVFNRQSSLELAILDENSQKALNIIALNLNLPTNAIPCQASFFQLGGDSVKMVATIVQLKEYGLHIPIEEFSSAKSIQTIIDHVVENRGAIGEMMKTDQFVVKPLHEVPYNERIIDVLVDSFIEKEPLDLLLGVTREEFMPFARSLFREARSGSLSLIVLDRASGEIVGGDFLFDYFKGVHVEHHESMSPILSLLRNFEEPIKEQLIRRYCGSLGESETRTSAKRSQAWVQAARERKTAISSSSDLTDEPQQRSSVDVNARFMREKQLPVVTCDVTQFHPVSVQGMIPGRNLDACKDVQNTLTDLSSPPNAFLLNGRPGEHDEGTHCSRAAHYQEDDEANTLAHRGTWCHSEQRLMYNFCLCVDRRLPHVQQVKICHLIEGYVLQVAKDNSFCGVVTNNTNPVTQDICEHFYDYAVLSKYLVRDFEYNGRKVFSHAPEGYHIKMMIKYL